MTYAQMIDLLHQARERGEAEEYTNEVLHEQFSVWLESLEVGALTEEEEEAVQLAFEEGYGIRPPCACQR